MSTSQEGTWIAGVVDGRPALFNIQTGETRQPQTALPKKKLKQQLKKRQRCKSREKQRPKQKGITKASGSTFRKLLNHVATDLATHWVVGQKGGRVFYFNTITKEERWSPPEVLKNPPRVTTNVLNDTTAPIASIVHEASYVPGQDPSQASPVFSSDVSSSRAENMDMDLEFDLQITEAATASTQKQDEELFHFLASDPPLPPAEFDEIFPLNVDKVAGVSMTLQRRLIPHPSQPEPPEQPKRMGKIQLRKMRNREASVRSRLKRQAKMTLLEDRIKELEVTIQKLHQTVAVKTAENGALISQVQFLQNLVTQSMTN